MDVAQSELDIYLSTEKKEKSVLDSMKEQLTKATANYNERRQNLQELEANQPKWTKALSDKQTELQKVYFKAFDLINIVGLPICVIRWLMKTPRKVRNFGQYAST